MRSESSFSHCENGKANDLKTSEPGDLPQCKSFELSGRRVVRLQKGLIYGLLYL